jgi:hypothetical protein
MSTERRLVNRRSIPFMLGEVVLRIAWADSLHIEVTRHLGENRRQANHRLTRITPHDRFLIDEGSRCFQKPIELHPGRRWIKDEVLKTAVNTALHGGGNTQVINYSGANETHGKVEHARAPERAGPDYERAANIVANAL